MSVNKSFIRLAVVLLMLWHKIRCGLSSHYDYIAGTILLIVMAGRADDGATTNGYEFHCVEDRDVEYLMSLLKRPPRGVLRVLIAYEPRSKRVKGEFYRELVKRIEQFGVNEHTHLDIIFGSKVDPEMWQGDIKRACRGNRADVYFEAHHRPRMVPGYWFSLVKQEIIREDYEHEDYLSPSEYPEDILRHSEPLGGRAPRDTGRTGFRPPPPQIFVKTGPTGMNTPHATKRITF